MRIIHYSQHVLGVGHLFRSLEIVKALHGHEVTFVTGGKEMALPVPPFASHVALPPLMMDADFSRLLTCGSTAGREVDEVMVERRELLVQLMRDVKPDVVLVELYPFGRKKFGFELDPALEEARRLGAKVVCSLRDILVEKADQKKFEDRVLERLGALFDAVLVHTDPEFITLDETFPAAERIPVPVYDTGYVTPRPEPGAAELLRAEVGLTRMPLIVASAGGGNVGEGLLEGVLEASALLRRELPHRLALFTGPYMAEERYSYFRSRADELGNIRVRRFTERFPVWLAACDLSISLAGYNTTMNLLAAGKYGLVLPFAQNREQAMRAERLEERGLLGVLGQEEIAPGRLAGRIREAMGTTVPTGGINLDGAAESARLLERIAAG